MLHRWVKCSYLHLYLHPYLYLYLHLRRWGYNGGVWMQSGWRINNAAVGLFPEMRSIPRFAGFAKFDRSINCSPPDLLTNPIWDFLICLWFKKQAEAALILFIFWHFVSFDRICCCVRSRRSKSLVKISGGFYRIWISGKLGWKNWLEWKPSASARPIKTIQWWWKPL